VRLGVGGVGCRNLYTAEVELPAVQHVASRYTDCDIPPLPITPIVPLNTRGIWKVKIQWPEKMLKAFYFDNDLRYVENVYLFIYFST
jgi:hypothetical protein